jgi:hypothetical protein
MPRFVLHANGRPLPQGPTRPQTDSHDGNDTWRGHVDTMFCPPIQQTWPPSPSRPLEAPQPTATMATTRGDWRGQDMLTLRHAPTLPCLCTRTCRIAVLLARCMSLGFRHRPRCVTCPSRLRALRCLSPRGCTHCVVCTASPYPLWLHASRHMHRIALPFTAARTASYAPRRLAPRGCTHRVAVVLVLAYSLIVRSLFFFF